MKMYVNKHRKTIHQMYVGKFILFFLFFQLFCGKFTSFDKYSIENEFVFSNHILGKFQKKKKYGPVMQSMAVCNTNSQTDTMESSLAQVLTCREKKILLKKFPYTKNSKIFFFVGKNENFQKILYFRFFYMKTISIRL